MSKKKTRILIADDHAIVREGLSLILNLQSDMTVVGQASNGRSAIQSAQTLKPDLVLMDIMMPDTDGIRATEEIARACPGVRVLLLTSSTNALEIKEALAVGARGVVSKAAPHEDLLNAIRTVTGGGKYVSSEIERTLESAEAPAVLTPRQQEMLKDISRGLTNEEIAKSRDLSKSAVKFHILGLFRRLGVSNRAEAVAIGLRKQGGPEAPST